ncbi:hypothetical protein L9F63_020769, partial [Diploptera punctata]
DLRQKSTRKNISYQTEGGDAKGYQQLNNHSEFSKEKLKHCELIHLAHVRYLR